MFLYLRFIGVTRSPTGKWVSRGPVEGRLESTVVKLGVFPTEELAAQAYDKLQIYKARGHAKVLSPQCHEACIGQRQNKTDSYVQGLDTMHFPKGSYDLQPILMHKTIDDLVASIKKEARALNKTSRSVTCPGVGTLDVAG